jgi:hypothetical protein
VTEYDEIGRPKRKERPFERILTLRVIDNQAPLFPVEIDLAKPPSEFWARPDEICQEMHRNLDVILAKLRLHKTEPPARIAPAPVEAESHGLETGSL